MSADAQVAVLGAAQRRTARSGSDRRAAGASPTLPTFVAFTLLALYAALRWSTMLGAPYTGRSLGLVILALCVGAGGATAHGAQPLVRLGAVLFTIVACLAMFPASGIPLHLILTARFGATAALIGHGLGALPEVIVPYTGPSASTAMVIRLGAGMLLLGAALTVGTSRAPRGEARLAAAALPLIVLATIPSCLARPQVAYVHGLILFVLLAAFVFSERLADRPGAGVGALTAAAILALILSPGLDRHRAWISFDSLAGGTTYGSPETFNWSQTYGPLTWPHVGTTVLDVTARFPYDWKAEDLDGFNGRGWVSTPGIASTAADGITADNLKRWTQTLTVTVGGLRGTQLIEAGESAPPELRGFEIAAPGGTSDEWTTSAPLQGGERYTVTVYTPRPSAVEMAGAGTRYPASLAPDLQMTLPSGTLVQFPTFGHTASTDSVPDLENSSYARVYALAQSLRRGASTPYAYVEAVLQHLASGFTYTTDPPRSTLPLVTFLLRTRTGYCQQFAGAMALLLRMGGIPARVAVGFSTGSEQRRSNLPGQHTYAVTDVDAHAWVEAWFPGIGWTTFDPTPPGSPGTSSGISSGTTGLAASAGGASSGGASALLHKSNPKAHLAHARGSAPAAAAGRRAGRNRSSRLWPKLLLGAIVMLSLGLGLLERRRRRPVPTPERLVAELERAFARSGQPLDGGVTLGALERRLADRPGAVAYIDAIQRARFAGAPGEPTGSERRALRACLRRGPGPLGALRALIALPPRL